MEKRNWLALLSIAVLVGSVASAVFADQTCPNGRKLGLSVTAICTGKLDPTSTTGACESDYDKRLICNCVYKRQESYPRCTPQTTEPNPPNPYDIMCPKIITRTVQVKVDSCNSGGTASAYGKICNSFGVCSNYDQSGRYSYRCCNSGPIQIPLPFPPDPTGE